MRLSEHEEYRNAVIAGGDGDWDRARDQYQILIGRARHEGDDVILAYLLQQLGDVEAKSGRRDRGESLHAEALAIDPENPLLHLFYAKSLFRAFRQTGKAVEQLFKTQQILKGYEFSGGEDELPPEYYEDEIDKLRNEIRRAAP